MRGCIHLGDLGRALWRLNAPGAAGVSRDARERIGDFFKVGNMGNSEFLDGGRGWLFLPEEGVWSVVALCVGFEAVS